jgi:hypothetical protein
MALLLIVVEMLRDGEIRDPASKGGSTRIHMSEFGKSGYEEDEDDDLQMTNVYA